MNSAFPSGAAVAEILPKSKKKTNANMPREHTLYSGFNNSGTGIKLKINFPLIKAVAKLQTIAKSCTHFPKNVFQYWRGFQPFFSIKKILIFFSS